MSYLCSKTSNNFKLSSQNPYNDLQLSTHLPFSLSYNLYDLISDHLFFWSALLQDYQLLYYSSKTLIFLCSHSRLLPPYYTPNYIQIRLFCLPINSFWTLFVKSPFIGLEHATSSVILLPIQNQPALPVRERRTFFFNLHYNTYQDVLP